MFTIEIIVHLPETEKEMAAVRAQISKLQAQYVYHYVDGLSCPLWQKHQLLDAVAETCLEQAREEKRDHTSQQKPA